MKYKLIMGTPSFGKGVFFATTAYTLWGLLPVYWNLLSPVNTLHILAYRILFSMLLMSCMLFAGKNTSWLKFYKNRRTALLMTLTALLISFNWGLYLVAVNTGRTIETSLGYYINPLLSIVLGLIVFKEKLKPLQAVAFGFATAGVLIITLLTGKLPMISLLLAFSFAIYGFLKKTINLTALESMGVETLIASPLGLLMLFTSFGAHGGLDFPTLQGFSYFTELPLYMLFLLALSGLVSSFPLYLFAKSAKMLPLSTLGFLQFLAPTLTFLTGLFILKESFPPQNFIAFGFIWAAAILYIISLKGSTKKPSVQSEGMIQ